MPEPIEGTNPAPQAQVDQVGQQGGAQAPTQAPGQPQSMTDRTQEQFSKLLDSNKRLFEANEQLRKEMEQRRQQQDVFAGVQRTPPPQAPTAQPQTVDPRDFVETDPVSGEQYINQAKLNARLEEVTQRASKAEQAIQQYIKTAEEREIERQNAEAFASYPELKPGVEKFDAKLHRQVRGVLYDSMLNADEYGGRPLTFREAADFVTGKVSKEQQVSKAKAEENAGTADSADAAAQALKEQGSAQASSQPQNAPVQSDSDELMQLRVRTRYGDDEALARRIMNTDHVLKKSESES